MNRHAYLLNVLIVIVKLYSRQVAKIYISMSSVWMCLIQEVWGFEGGGVVLIFAFWFFVCLLLLFVYFLLNLHCLSWYLGIQQAHSTRLTLPEVTRSDYSITSLDPTLGILCSLQLPQLPNTPHGMLFFGRTISNFITECRTLGQ